MKYEPPFIDLEGFYDGQKKWNMEENL